MNLAKTFGAVFITMMTLDLIWLGQITSGFYASQMDGLVQIADGKMKIQYFPALLVYVLMTSGIVFFVLPRLQTNDSWLTVIFTGMFLGLIVFGVYDLTNLATITKWSWGLSIADMAWGAFAFGAATCVGHWIRS